MNYLKSLLEQRAQIQGEMESIFATCEKEKRSRNDAEKAKFTELQTKRDALDTEIKDLEEVEKRKKESATTIPSYPASHETRGEFSEQEKKNFKNFSIVRGLQLLANNKPLDGLEAEVHAIAEQEARASGIKIEGFAVPAFLAKEKRGQSATGQTTNPGDQGGVFVATEVNGLIESLWSKNFLSEVGATRFAGLVGNQDFPVAITKPTAEEVAEIATLTDQEILFSEISMTPNRRGATVPISKQLLLQASFDVQNFVIDQIRKSLDYKLNADSIAVLLAAITSGNSNLLALGANGASPTYEHMVGLETLISAADADKGNIKYLTNSKVRGKLKLTQKFTGTNGDPVWEKGNEVNGYSAAVSNIVPSNLTKGTASGICSAILMGNFADFYVGMWGGVDFVVDPYTLAKKAQVQITANMFWDTVVARAASFAGIKDALTT